MKFRITTLALAVVTALAAVTPLCAQAQPAKPATTGAAAVAVAPGAAMAIETVKTTATVVGIDPASRVVTLKRQDGQVFNLTAGEQVRNFAQLRMGDKVTAEYTHALSLELKKSGSAVRERTEKEAATRTPLGAKPGGAVGRQVTYLANVVAVDAKKQLVTLRGPLGGLVDLKVQDPQQLKNIKKGDQVEAVYTEALAVSVEATPQSAGK